MADDYYIAGVQEEALRYYKSPEAYRNSIENKIKANMWIEKRYMEQILRNIDFVKYSDRTLIILRIQNEGEAIKFDGNMSAMAPIFLKLKMKRCLGNVLFKKAHS